MDRFASVTLQKRAALGQGAMAGLGALGGAAIGGGLTAALSGGDLKSTLTGAGVGAVGGAGAGLAAHGHLNPTVRPPASRPQATGAAPQRGPGQPKRAPAPQPATQIVRDRAIMQQHPAQGYAGLGWRGPVAYKFDPAMVYHVDTGVGPMPMHYVGHDQQTGSPVMRNLADSTAAPVNMASLQAPIERSGDKHSWSLAQARAASGNQSILPASDEHLAWHDAMFGEYA